MSDPARERINELVAALSPEQRSAVEAFIRYLQERSAPARSDVSAALEEFVSEHSDLLRRLAR